MPQVTKPQDGIDLHWRKFDSWKEACLGNNPCSYPCVYVVADKGGKPLYIGKAAQRLRKINGTLWAGGLKSRYVGRWGALDAFGQGSHNLVFVGKPEKKVSYERLKKLIGDVELELIYSEQPEFNDNGKTNPPPRRSVLRHSGEYPKFN